MVLEGVIVPAIRCAYGALQSARAQTNPGKAQPSDRTGVPARDGANGILKRTPLIVSNCGRKDTVLCGPASPDNRVARDVLQFTRTNRKMCADSPGPRLFKRHNPDFTQIPWTGRRDVRGPGKKTTANRQIFTATSGISPQATAPWDPAAEEVARPGKSLTINDKMCRPYNAIPLPDTIKYSGCDPVGERGAAETGDHDEGACGNGPAGSRKSGSAAKTDKKPPDGRIEVSGLWAGVFTGLEKGWL